jgi:hypothetical protein
MRSRDLLVYKEPFLAFAPELAYRALPDARIVYIFRDGRDVADSLVRSYDVLSDRKLADLESNEAIVGRRVGDRCVPWWVAHGDEHTFLDAPPYVRASWTSPAPLTAPGSWTAPTVSGRVLQVRYEDLVRDPLAHGEAIVRHLERQLTPRMRQRLRGAHPRSVGIHARRGEDELRAAERIAAAELTRLSYPLTAAAR